MALRDAEKRAADSKGIISWQVTGLGAQFDKLFGTIKVRTR